MCGMPEQSPTRSSAAGRPRPDASMSLLTNVMDHALDDGYAEASARRTSGAGGLPRGVRGRLWLGAGLVLAALVVTLGAAQAHHAAPVVAKERQELIDRVGSETAHADDLEHDVDGLRRDVAQRQQAALRQHGGGRAPLLSVLAGATDVHGPGVKLVVDDAKDTESGGGANPRENAGFSDTGRVRDRDMQRVVNGLWAAGAEAVSVNGQRLTSLSAIRAAGDAILVDNRPLAPPYTVLAVGDGGKLAARFKGSADGTYLDTLASDFGIRVSLSAQDDVRVPAAPSLVLRAARPLKSATGKTEEGTS
ncbi:DUF881 domain-containing protein [Streptomyces montanisoli]|uniref:DUF881 domain-containing protein n=1 Tax=Streptomyces montanisoli TaxID=2798581 RepID=A0A940MBF8_9ACTN|nr:DUF881 domain-containing protein [Streptomyces montanisoli]MBP0458209.1 DUF881 domain-containing protein [Streptomyces montanisoli]